MGWSTIDTNVTDMAFSPNFANDNTVFATTNGAGAFRSLQDGVPGTWHPLIAALPIAHADTVAVAACTGQKNTVSVGGEGKIYRSVDNGNTWEHVANQWVNTLAVSPDYCDDCTAFAGHGGGVLRSTDCGRSWAQPGTASFTALEVALSPAYAQDDTLFVATRDQGIQKSSDGGFTWSQLTSGAPHWSTSSVALASDYCGGGDIYGGFGVAGLWRYEDPLFQDSFEDNVLFSEPWGEVACDAGQVKEYGGALHFQMPTNPLSEKSQGCYLRLPEYTQDVHRITLLANLTAGVGNKSWIGLAASCGFDYVNLVMSPAYVAYGGVNISVTPLELLGGQYPISRLLTAEWTGEVLHMTIRNPSTHAITGEAAIPCPNPPAYYSLSGITNPGGHLEGWIDDVTVWGDACPASVTPSPTPTSTATHTPSVTPTPTSTLPPKPTWIYLPLIRHSFPLPTPTPSPTPTITPPPFFEGPWEVEPNNTVDRANGPLRPNRDYFGRPEDEFDVFYFETTGSGQIVADLTNHLGNDVQFHLIYADTGELVEYDDSPSYHIEYYGQAGRYVILVYTAPGSQSSNPYTLNITFR